MQRGHQLQRDLHVIPPRCTAHAQSVRRRAELQQSRLLTTARCQQQVEGLARRFLAQEQVVRCSILGDAGLTSILARAAVMQMGAAQGMAHAERGPWLVKQSHTGCIEARLLAGSGRCSAKVTRLRGQEGGLQDLQLPHTPPRCRDGPVEHVLVQLPAATRKYHIHVSRD
jgi:hypothetical protein